METVDPLVHIVDDDEAVRHFLRELMSSVGLEVQTYESAPMFLDTFDPDRPGCILLDIRMPGMSGLELQQALVERGVKLPVIILTGHGDVQVAVHAMKSGALDFIEKPFNNEILLIRVQKAVAGSVEKCEEQSTHDEIRGKFDLLTKREQQVFQRVAEGETNKSIARHFDISEKTVENHRAKVMEKMQAESLASLVRMMLILEQK